MSSFSFSFFIDITSIHWFLMPVFGQKPPVYVMLCALRIPLSERYIMSKITEKDVSYVAALAQLQLDDAARTRLVKEMGDILSYMDTLNALDTEGVEPMMHALEMTNVFREDEVGTPLSHEEALKNAPLDDGAYFLVPKILDGGGKS